MSAITIEHLASNGQLQQATFLPEKGMNLISFKRGNIEVIDQSTLPLFEERFAGLGALIGPHFHRRNPDILPTIKNEDLFAHIARVKAKGTQDPFSHGIARYAPWKAEVAGNAIKATLSGKDKWHDVPLAELEGQNFNMIFKIELKENGLNYNLSIVSDTDSLVGFHYYYSLPTGKGRVISQVQNQVIIDRKLQPLPPEWNVDSQKKLIFDLDQEADFTFRPSPNPLQGTILLDAYAYQLKVEYQTKCEENSWQLYHPAGASFVCIEPLSAQDPRHPKLSVSALQVNIEIL